MCIQDWQIGRLIRSVTRNITVDVTLTDLLPPNLDRVAVTFACSGNDGVALFPDPLTASDSGIDLNTIWTNTVGLDVSTNYRRQMLHFTLKDHGDLPTRRWRALTDVAPIGVLVIEYLLPEDVLRLTPDKLRQRV